MAGGYVGERKRCDLSEKLLGERRSGAGVVDSSLRRLVVGFVVEAVLPQKVCLEFIGCLSRIVQPRSIPRPVRGVEFRSACLRRASDPLKVVPERLPLLRGAAGQRVGET
jgi:hypothetical protein